MRGAQQQTIGASEPDLRNNRLGLMSAAQIDTLATQIDEFQSKTAHTIKRSVQLAAAVTLGVVILTFVRVLLLPFALVIEIMVVGIMLAMTSNLNRFVQLLELDRESEAVRIIKGRTSRFSMRPAPHVPHVARRTPYLQAAGFVSACPVHHRRALPTVLASAFRRGHRRRTSWRKGVSLPSLVVVGSQRRKMRMLRALP